LTEQASGTPGFWAEEFDLSALSYPQFLAFFFDRPVDGNKERYDLFRSGIDYFIASNPTTVVAHVQAMCRDFSELTKAYSHEQLDQGLWAVFGAGISCERFLFDPIVDLGLRIGCIESMYLPFRDVVANSTIGKDESFYWMWWDMILHTFWQEALAFIEPKLGIKTRSGLKIVGTAQSRNWIIGKRAANITGEVMVEVSSGKQQLKTQYSDRNGSHAEAGGEIDRDEVYFAQMGRLPAGKNKASAPADPKVKSAPSSLP
jgi:hypothetical protein